MTRIFLFDVDGTLTPPRQPMNSHFAEYFDEFSRSENVFLISGSDYAKIKEQVPINILLNCQGVFGCSGAEYVENDVAIYRKEHEFPEALLEQVSAFIDDSPYSKRCGNHVEHRPGMLNVSVIGRDATLDQRKHYHEWDMLHDERYRFANKLVETFAGYEASCGGEISIDIGIDIVPTGWNKSVVKHEVLEKFPDSSLIFFGDRMGAQGNDKPLADVLNTPSGKHSAISVDNYKDTWIHLRHFSGAQPINASTSAFENEKRVYCSTVH